MKLLGILLAKDLKRVRRNPVPWLLALLLPFLITGLIGFVFGGSGSGGGLGTIRIAVVDEGDSVLTEILRNSFNHPNDDQPVQFEAVLLERDEAVARVTNNELSAALVVPANFLDQFLAGEEPAALELIKNPAQGIHPAIVEEMTATLVTVLNGARRVLGDELPKWREVFDDEGEFDLLTVGGLLVDAGNDLAVVRDYLFPPLITFASSTRADASEPARPEASLFGYVLLGLIALCLLMMADQGMRDLYREFRFRTLLRYRTARESLMTFISSKVIFAAVTVVLGAVIMFAGGAAIFGIDWPHPFVLAALTVCYAAFAAGFLGLLAALAGSERRADLLNTLVVMVVGLAGGCMFPPEMFPPFLREVIMPLMPTAWFAEAGRGLLSGDPNASTLMAGFKLAGMGVVCIGLAAIMFRWRIGRGEVRAE